MQWTSLSLFTVLSQAAAGLVLLYLLFDLAAKPDERAGAHLRLGQHVRLTAALTTGAAMLISLEHLGWPLYAWRALGGLPSSWLSWEVLLTGLFAAGSLAAWWAGRKSAVPPGAMAALALLGLGAAYASGMIYTLPSMPANAGGFPVLFFLATALLGGAAALMLLLTLTAAGRALLPHWGRPLALGAVGAILLVGALTLAYAGAAASGAPEARAQAALYAGSLWYGVRLLGGLALPGLLLVWAARQPRTAQPMLVVAALLVVAGELAGRLLFFTSSVFTGVGTGL